MDLRKKLRALAGDETLSIEHVRFDRTLFSEVLDQSSRLKALVEAGRDYPAFRDLVEDLFLSLYKVDPRQIPPERMRWTHRPNHEALRMTMETPAHRDARASSVQDELISALGVIRFGEELLERIKQTPELERLFKPPSPPPAGPQDQGAPGPAGGTPPPGGAPDPNAGPGQGGADDGAAPPDPQAVEAMMQALQHNAQALRQAARAAAGAASDAAEQAAEALAAWGFDRGMLQHLPLDEQLALVERLLENPSLRDISKLLGAMRSLLRGMHRHRTHRPPDTLYGIERGADLARVLPQELALLRNARLKPLFYARLLDRGLTQYRLVARERGAMGPFVMCLDASGSTRGPVQAWIKAIALAMAQFARQQRRDFGAIVFGASQEELVTVEVPARIAADEYIRRVVELGTAFFGGGTSFDAPLQRAVELIEQSPGLGQADIVLVTDGYCAVSDETAAMIRQVREQRGLRLYGVLIGNVDPASLQPVADRVVTVEQTDLDAAQAVFRAVFERERRRFS